ncbi:MAG: methylmalonyl Co-A mutase-associated GTPase MeaB [Synergistaceae bacterium]|jgi:LAO/AO transport system kinase|nr:methylmalonyl Co-A mutase-associated GTPase MeaB [Synergistaceae bacterium]
MDSLFERALAGDKRSIARLVSEVERRESSSRDLMRQIYPYTGKAHTIGITGSPGAGKSTLSSRLITLLRSQGHRVGVIAVDPSSPFTGGAILGDRLRMQEHSLDPGVFIRSMGSRGNLGGLSGATREAALILDACGYDTIIIETVGVGQSEIDVIRISDTVCLVLVPGMGDDVQIMKAGIMEIADVFVVNKSDRDGAEKVVADVRIMLDIIPARPWRPPVSLTSAEHDSGIEEFLKNIELHRDYLSRTEDGRARKLIQIEAEVEDSLRRDIASRVSSAWDAERADGICDRIEKRETDPYTVASDILGRILK